MARSGGANLRRVARVRLGQRQRVFVAPIGILDRLVIEARRDMSFDVIDPMTGMLVSSHTLAAAEQIELSGHEALVLSGTYR